MTKKDRQHFKDLILRVGELEEIVATQHFMGKKNKVRICPICKYVNCKVVHFLSY